MLLHRRHVKYTRNRQRKSRSWSTILRPGIPMPKLRGIECGSYKKRWHTSRLSESLTQSCAKKISIMSGDGKWKKERGKKRGIEWTGPGVSPHEETPTPSPRQMTTLHFFKATSEASEIPILFMPRSSLPTLLRYETGRDYYVTSRITKELIFNTPLAMNHLCHMPWTGFPGKDKGVSTIANRTNTESAARIKPGSASRNNAPIAVIFIVRKPARRRTVAAVEAPAPIDARITADPGKVTAHQVGVYAVEVTQVISRAEI